MTTTMTGWAAVQRGVKINYNLEISPLQIRTESETAIGSNEIMNVWFVNAQGETAGAFILIFSSPPLYALNYCTRSYKNFPTALPSETDKVWMITRSSGTPSVVIHCNNKEILNVVLSDSTCDDSVWKTLWSRDVKDIIFKSNDGASDYYKLGK